jgi:AraC family transcriptional regulator
MWKDHDLNGVGRLVQDWHNIDRSRQPKTIPSLPSGEFLSATIAVVRHAAVVLRETIHPPGQRTPVHEHEAMHFCYTLRGRQVERIGLREYTWGPGSLSGLPAGMPHANLWGPQGGRCFTVTPSPQLWNRLSDAKLASSGFWVAVDTPEARRVLLALYHEFVNPDAVTPLAVEGLLLTLVTVNIRGRAQGTIPRQPWIHRVKEYLSAHCMTPIRLSDVSAAFGIEETTLCRAFRRSTGSTMGEEVRRLRIEWAARRLVESEDTIAAIAHAAGFADHAHFTRTFRRWHGMSPNAYRQLHRR